MPGSTPIFAFPYPTYSDPTNLAGSLQTLAEAVDNEFEDASALLTSAQQRPHVKATNVTPQSLLNGATTTFTFTTEELDNAGMFPGSGTTITCTVSGLYLVSASVAWDNSTAGDREIRAQVNGVTRASSWVDAAFITAFVGSTTATDLTMLMNITAGQTLTLVGSQNSGGSLNANTAMLSAVRIA
jgi:hypothetical protein